VGRRGLRGGKGAWVSRRQGIAKGGLDQKGKVEKDFWTTRSGTCYGERGYADRRYTRILAHEGKSAQKLGEGRGGRLATA